MPSTITKVVENRLRRVARRQGYVLRRSRMRDPRGIGYGGYRLEGHPMFADDPMAWTDGMHIASLLQEPLEKP
jgi:hypothetical protein